MSEEKCNLVVYTEKKAKTSAYDNLMEMAQGIAKDMSPEDAARLKANPTPKTLKSIMEKNNG